MRNERCTTHYALPPLLADVPNSLPIGSRELVTLDSFYNVQWAVWQESRVPRRQLVAGIQARVLEWGGQLQTVDDVYYPLPYDFGLIFGNDAPDYRWITTYKKVNAAGEPFHRCIKSVERLRWLDIFLALTHEGWWRFRQDAMNNLNDRQPRPSKWKASASLPD